MLKEKLFDAIDSVQALFFPPLCLHCKEPLPKELHVLCSSCLEQLEFLSYRGRCQHCFQELSKRYCTECRKMKPPYDYAASIFDAYGPSKSIGDAFLMEKRYYLAKSIAPFFLVQHEQLQWQIPDCVVSGDDSFFSKIIHGENPSTYITKEVAKLFSCEYKQVSKKANFHNKIVLLVDLIDAGDSRATRFHTASLIKTSHPKKLYVMSFLQKNITTNNQSSCD